MNIERHFTDAIADFEALIAEGWETDAAVVEAATSNGLKPAALEGRLSNPMTIEARVEKIRRDQEYDRFVGVLQSEIDKANKTGGVGLFTRMSYEKFEELLRNKLGRELTEHEKFMVEDRLKPWISDLRLQIKYGLKAVRKNPLRNS